MYGDKIRELSEFSLFIPGGDYFSCRDRFTGFCLCVFQIEIQIFWRNSFKEKCLVSYEQMCDRRVFFCDSQCEFEVFHVFYEIWTDPDADDDCESVFLRDFWDAIHAVECCIDSDTAKSFCYDGEISIDSFWCDECLILIESVFITIGTIAHAVETLRSRLDGVWSIEISPPARVGYEQGKEKYIFEKAYIEHGKIGD